MPSFFCMPFFACNRQVDSLDKRQCNLHTIPHEIDRYARTLEELLLDMNHIKELPKSLFRLQKLRRLCLSDNDIHRIPSDIACLQELVELNISRNDISDLPEDLKLCRNLLALDVSSNPIARLPDSITNVLSLTHLSLNDTSLTKLPQDIGRLVQLKSLEVRENHLHSLPPSIVKLFFLKRLDLGQNELDELPAEIGALRLLEELYVDDNSIELLPESILRCKELEQLDASSNRILNLPADIGDLEKLVDLTLSHNCLSSLPSSIGRLKCLSILRLDDNSLVQLTPAIGSCTMLNELYLTQNLLTELPSSIGNLRNLQHLNVDKNQLANFPALIGECSSLSLLSLRDNQLEELPMEIGKLSQLRVFDVCNNRLSYLPFTIKVLDNLQALWLSENQSQALLRWQQDTEPKTGIKVLTCYLLPQQSANSNEMKQPPTRAFVGGPKVHFGDMDADGEGVEVATTGNFERHGTPHPKPHLNAPGGKQIRKPSIDGHILPKHENQPASISLSKKPSIDNGTHIPSAGSLQGSQRMPRSALKHSIYNQNSSNSGVDYAEAAKESRNVAFSGGSSSAAFNDQNEKSTECRLKRVNTPHYGKGYRIGSGSNSARSQQSSSTHNDNQQQASSPPPTTSANVTVFSAQHGCPPANTSTVQHNSFNNSYGHYQQQQYSRQPYYCQQQQHPSNNPSPHTGYFQSINGDGGSSGGSSTQQHSATAQAQPHYTDGMLESDVSSSISMSDLIKNSNKRLFKRVVIRREPSQGLGLSIAGGVESNPYIEGDSGLFISKLIPGAPAEKAGLRVGDKVLEINAQTMVNERHDVAVQCIQRSPDVLSLVVMRQHNSDKELSGSGSQSALNTMDDSVQKDNNQQARVEKTSQQSPSTIGGAIVAANNLLSTKVPLNEHGAPNFVVSEQCLSSSTQRFIISSMIGGGGGASSNVEVGDALLSVNGTNLADKTLDDLRVLLRGLPNHELYVVVQKGAAAPPFTVNGGKAADVQNNGTSGSGLVGNYVNVSASSPAVRNGGASVNNAATGKTASQSSLISTTATANQQSVSNSLISSATALSSSKMADGGNNNSAKLNSVSDLRYGDSSLDGLVEEVQLIRDAKNALGLSIVGGVDHCSHPFGANNPGVFISKIASGSPAAKCRRLRLGDRILNVNGRDVEKAKHSEAVDALKNSGPLLKICVKHEPQPRGLKEMTFRRRNGEKLGLSICGGINSPPMNVDDPTDEGIFIEHVESHGCASNCADIKAGLRILEVNDDSLLGCTKNEAAEMLRAVPDVVRLLVCDGLNAFVQDIDVNNAGLSASRTNLLQHQPFLSSTSSFGINNNLDPLSTPSPIPPQSSTSAQIFDRWQQQSDNADSHLPLPTSTRFSTALPAKKVPPPVAPKPKNAIASTLITNNGSKNHLHQQQQQQSHRASPLFELAVTTVGAVLSNTNFSVTKNVTAPTSSNSSSATFLSVTGLADVFPSSSSSLTLHPRVRSKEQNGGGGAKNTFANVTSTFGIAPSNSTNNSNSGLGNGGSSSSSSALEQRELEQQKRSEWRKARLASLDAEANLAEELFNCVQQEISKLSNNQSTVTSSANKNSSQSAHPQHQHAKDSVDDEWRMNSTFQDYHNNNDHDHHHSAKANGCSKSHTTTNNNGTSLSKDDILFADETSG